MTLAETIQIHVHALPAGLQRETLDFTAWLETRHGIPASAVLARSPTEEFIVRHAGVLGDDFPDDIDESDLRPAIANWQA
ncbi:MAG: DUF2281 domain-containing protein [Pseudomonadota bacterium]